MPHFCNKRMLIGSPVLESSLMLMVPRMLVILALSLPIVTEPLLIFNPGIANMGNLIVCRVLTTLP